MGKYINYKIIGDEGEKYVSGYHDKDSNPTKGITSDKIERAEKVKRLKAKVK
jgi:hypothetical protein